MYIVTVNGTFYSAAGFVEVQAVIKFTVQSAFSDIGIMILHLLVITFPEEKEIYPGGVNGKGVWTDRVQGHRAGPMFPLSCAFADFTNLQVQIWVQGLK